MGPSLCPQPVATAPRLLGPVILDIPLPPSTQLLPSRLTSHQPHFTSAWPLLRAPTSTNCSLLYCRLCPRPLLDMLSPQHSGPLMLGHTAAPHSHLCCCVICLAWPQTLMTSRQWATVDRELEKVTWSQPGGEQGLLYAQPTHSDSLPCVTCPPHILRCVPVCYPTQGRPAVSYLPKALPPNINSIMGPSHC